MIVEAQADSAVVFGLHDEVGDDLLEILPNSFSHRASRTRIELHQFRHGVIVLLFGDVQLLQDFILVLLGEVIATLVDDVVFDLFQGRVFLALDLQEETLLKASCADARRVKILNDRKHVFHFFGSSVDSLIDSKFVNNGINVFPQESVIV